MFVTGISVMADGENRWVAPSKSGGAGHAVEVKAARDGSHYVMCSCPAGRFSYGTKPGCWAMKAVRQIVGLTR